MGGVFEGELICVYVQLSPFAVGPKLSKSQIVNQLYTNIK